MNLTRMSFMAATLTIMIPLYAPRNGHQNTPHLALAQLPYAGTAKGAQRNLLETLNQGLWGVFIGSNYVESRGFVDTNKFYQDGIAHLRSIQPILDKKFNLAQVGHSPAFLQSCLKGLVLRGEHELLSSLMAVLPHDIGYIYEGSGDESKHSLLDVAEVQLHHLCEAGVSIENARKVRAIIINEGGEYLMLDRQKFQTLPPINLFNEEDDSPIWIDSDDRPERARKKQKIDEPSRDGDNAEASLGLIAHQSNPVIPQTLTTESSLLGLLLGDFTLNGDNGVKIWYDEIN
jgi:hypothetical protein